MLVVFDIGGTNTRVARSADGKTLRGRAIVVPTGKDFKTGTSRLQKAVRDLVGGGKEKVKWVGGGVAGTLSRAGDKLLDSPNLPGWIGKPLKKTLSEIFGAPVSLENDAALGALGEAVSGAGRGFRIVGYLTVGTGVGGARVVEGQIDQNARGFEPGRQFISDKGDLEFCVSGAAFMKRHGRRAEEITDKAIWRGAARDLGRGLFNLSVLWSPDVLVLGGPMILGRPRIPIAEAKQVMQKAGGAIFMPEIRQAELGDSSGLYGALALKDRKKRV